MKKKYISPELDILLLEQSDIITTSGGEVSGGAGGGGVNPGAPDPFDLTWD